MENIEAKIVKLISSTKAPGEFVSVDQMESSIPGHKAQMKGIPTRERYKVMTVFVDHATDFIFVYMQKDTTSAETLRAKIEFGRIARSYGVIIQ
jgi:hypothetical protein